MYNNQKKSFVIMKQKLIYGIWNYMTLDYWHSRSLCIQGCLKAESHYHQTILLCICIAYIMCLQCHTVSCFVIFIWETDSRLNIILLKRRKKKENTSLHSHMFLRQQRNSSKQHLPCDLQSSLPCSQLSKLGKEPSRRGWDLLLVSCSMQHPCLGQ